MELFIRKLGNSAGIILPAALLRSLNLSVGSLVTAEKVKGKLALTPALKPRYKKWLRLVGQYFPFLKWKPCG